MLSIFFFKYDIMTTYITCHVSLRHGHYISPSHWAMEEIISPNDLLTFITFAL
jgi:hypothetical protein